MARRLNDAVPKGRAAAFAARIAAENLISALKQTSYKRLKTAKTMNY
jgi:hypothetical protein